MGILVLGPDFQTIRFLLRQSLLVSICRGSCAANLVDMSDILRSVVSMSTTSIASRCFTPPTDLCKVATTEVRFACGYYVEEVSSTYCLTPTSASICNIAGMCSRSYSSHGNFIFSVGCYRQWRLKYTELCTVNAVGCFTYSTDT